MPTPLVTVFVAAYAASAVVLFVCAGMGFRQGIVERILEGIAGLQGLVNAVGVPFADHVTLCSLLWFAAPCAAAANVLRIRRAAKLHQEQLAATYVAESKDR
jgi:hypothetical protein